MSPAEFAALLKRFEDAVDTNAFSGAYPPEDRDGLQQAVDVLSAQLSDAYAAAYADTDTGLSSDQSVAIGEHAFRAGFMCGVQRHTAHSIAPIPQSLLDYNMHDGWSSYDPPEELKGL